MSWLKNKTNFTIYRNSDKKESLDADSLVVLVLKIVFDSASRIVLFSCWLYVYNDGQFSTWIVFFAYYLVVIFLLIFNLIFNDTREFSSMTYWIGIVITIIVQIKDIFSGILMNTFSSTFSYNNFDFNLLMGKSKKKQQLHQPSFLRQFLYFLIFLTINIRCGNHKSIDKDFIHIQ